MTESDWLLGASRDDVSITADWAPVGAPQIDGVEVLEVRNVQTDYGYLTELYREDWGLRPSAVGQVFQSVLHPGRFAAWHVHGVTTDRLFVAGGRMLVALYDARSGSPTQGAVMVARSSILRPQLIVVPPRVWHGVKNVGDGQATLVNIVDVAYQYDGPDHYRLAADSAAIPFDIVSAL